mmetsp:Transcript_5849/g.13551  ORF Transcript_5849/g.13551 Transcript_5849/m.13551 type:complete len:906 (-) Transcript_5849:1086-3803(-)
MSDNGETGTTMTSTEQSPNGGAVAATDEAAELGDCCICYTPVTHDPAAAEADDELALAAPRQLCSSSCNATVCRECVVRHMTITIKDGFDGKAVAMTCPACGPTHIMKSRVWSELLASHDPSLLETVQQRAANLLSLQCFNCHKRSNALFEDYTNDESNTELLKKLMGGDEAYAQLDLIRTDYLRGFSTDREGLLRAGAVKATDLLCGIEALLGDRAADVITAGDQTGPAPLIKPLLNSIEDPERRATLQVSYLRKHPQIITKCCGLEHCFNCHVKGSHQGQTCDEYQASKVTVDDVIPCPKCQVNLVKGDGCNAINCICGHSFDWGEQLSQLHERLAKVFEDAYPSKPSEVAAHVLYTSDPPHLKVQARAWANSNPGLISTARSDLWTRKMGSHAAEAALQAQTSGSPTNPNSILAREYAKHHQADIQAQKETRKHARAAAWQAYHGPNSACAAIYGLLNPRTLHGRLRLQHGAWCEVAENQKLMSEEGARVRIRHAEAWDYLHGGAGNELYSEDAALEAADGIGGRAEAVQSDTLRRLLDDWCRVNKDRMTTARARRWAARCLEGADLEHGAVALDPTAVALDVEETVAKRPSRKVKLDLDAFVKLNGPRVDELRAARSDERARRFAKRFAGVARPERAAAQHAFALAPGAEVNPASAYAVPLSQWMGDWYARARRMLRSRAADQKEMLLEAIAWVDASSAQSEFEYARMEVLYEQHQRKEREDKARLGAKNSLLDQLRAQSNGAAAAADAHVLDQKTQGGGRKNVEADAADSKARAEAAEEELDAWLASSLDSLGLDQELHGGYVKGIMGGARRLGSKPLPKRAQGVVEILSAATEHEFDEGKLTRDLCARWMALKSLQTQAAQAQKAVKKAQQAALKVPSATDNKAAAADGVDGADDWNVS